MNSLTFLPNGLLPPFIGSPTENDRSPYKVPLSIFIHRFNTTTERKELLKGYLYYRIALHEIGIQNGFQWINGSFVENCEIINQRSPSDIDVITYFIIGPNRHETIKNCMDSNLFDSRHTKPNYKCDAYGCELILNIQLIEAVTYWYSLFSHKRDTFEWKGFLQIDLSPQNERELLRELEA